MTPQIAHFDLTQRPPRSFRVRLGNLATLPRMLDKGRATLVGKNGEYRYNAPMDQHLIRFLQFDPEALLKEIATGKGDWELFQWIQENSKTPREPWEIEAWSNYMDKRGPDSDAETLEIFAKYVRNSTTVREDIKTWFEVLELDDYVTFGGKP